MTKSAPVAPRVSAAQSSESLLIWSLHVPSGRSSMLVQRPTRLRSSSADATVWGWHDLLVASDDEAHGGPTVRRAKDADAQAMAELARSAYALYVAPMGREPAPMTDDYVTVVRDEEAWVAEQAGRLVGLLVLQG